MTRAASVALVVLALLLPFELREPLLRAGPIQITSVELALYLALALWVASGGLRRFTWKPVHVAVAAWALVHLASAAMADAERGASFKFALRVAGGCALAFAASDLGRDARLAAGLLFGLVAGAALSASAALAEAWFPVAADRLGVFKTATARSGQLVRAGGPFQYPNVAALYWSAALPLALVLSRGRDIGGRVPRRWPAILAALALASAVVASASRAGLVVAGLALVAVWVAGGRRSGLRGRALGTLAGLLAALALDAASRPVVAERWRPGLDTPWYRARFAASPTELEVPAGSTATVAVEARNEGALSWSAGGAHPMVVADEWRDADGGSVDPGPPISLPADMAPGETAKLLVTVRAPDAPGRYRLRWQLVSEGAAWADPLGESSGEVAVTVTGVARGVERTRSAARPVQHQPTRLELWRAGLRMWREHPVFGVGPDNFRRLYSSYLGPRRLDERVAANSLYVETLADLGVVGAAALAGLAAALVQAARRAGSSASPDGLAFAVAAALAAFFVHGLVDHVLPFTPAYGLFWMLVGLLAARAARGGEPGA